ncbi:MAG: hypothetical protein RL514_3151 [Verrucomicrobiota bacterium]|jgi:hypothetical protein
MARINETERLQMLDLHLPHWGLADALTGGPIVLPIINPDGTPGTYARTDLVAQRAAYQTITDAIMVLEETTLPALRSERDDLFGVDGTDVDGVWIRLLGYKGMVVARLGARHALARTVPNLGLVRVTDYLDIIERFHAHWLRVNAALPVAAPLTVGPLTAALLLARRGALTAKLKEVSDAELEISVKRADREQFFGDEATEVREPNSIIARLLQYHATIEGTFPGQPIADTLPRIFPQDAAALPRFDFNWRDLGGGQLKTWLRDPGLADAVEVHLVEGAVTLNQAYSIGGPPVKAQTWAGVTMVGELDGLELRDATGHTIARGRRDTTLAEV